MNNIFKTMQKLVKNMILMTFKSKINLYLKYSLIHILSVVFESIRKLSRISLQPNISLP